MRLQTPVARFGFRAAKRILGMAPWNLQFFLTAHLRRSARRTGSFAKYVSASADSMEPQRKSPGLPSSPQLPASSVGTFFG
jgi:hypothetical protein